MPYQLQSGILDDTHTWQNENDRVAYERAFASGTLSEKRMAIALMTASPLTPDNEIRAQLTAPVNTPMLAPAEPITINDIFDGGVADPHAKDQSPTDYSGGNGGYTGSERGLASWY
jgi:hypothetical protein